MIYSIFALIFISAAHLVRDGTPPLPSTHLARAVAGLLCVLGAFLAVQAWQGALLGVCVWAGFYTDYAHARGQQARGWGDAGWLFVSGVSSLLPMALIATFVLNPWFSLSAMIGGLLKPPLWFLGHWLFPGRAMATRSAATAFGGVVGGLIVLMA